jgi:hypothetical protein
MIKRFPWNGRFQVQNQRLEQLLGRGRMSVMSLVDFTLALRIRWFRQICRADMSDHNWMIVLKHWMNEISITIKDIHKIDFLEQQMLGRWFQDNGLRFWASTFKFM